MRLQIDHHAAALHAGLGDFLNAEMAGALRFVAGDFLAVAIDHRTDDVRAGTKTVVVAIDRLAIAVQVEILPDMGKRIPLGGILQGEQHLVVADHVQRGGIVATQREVHVGTVTAAPGWRQHRRIAARIDDAAAGIIQRQRQAEILAGLYLGDALQNLCSRYQIKPAQFIIRTPIAPGRARRSLFPTRIIRHSRFPSAVHFNEGIMSGVFTTGQERRAVPRRRQSFPLPAGAPGPDRR